MLSIYNGAWRGTARVSLAFSSHGTHVCHARNHVPLYYERANVRANDPALWLCGSHAQRLQSAHMHVCSAFGMALHPSFAQKLRKFVQHDSHRIYTIRQCQILNSLSGQREKIQTMPEMAVRTMPLMRMCGWMGPLCICHRNPPTVCRQPTDNLWVIPSGSTRDLQGIHGKLQKIYGKCAGNSW